MSRPAEVPTCGDEWVASSLAAIGEIDEVLRLVLPGAILKQGDPDSPPTVPIVASGQQLFEMIRGEFAERSRRLLDDPAWGAALLRLLQPDSFSVSGDPPRVAFDPAALAAFHAAADASLGRPLADQLEGEVGAAISGIYLSARRATSSQLGEVAGSPSHRDATAIGVLARDSLFWIGGAYSSSISRRINAVVASAVAEGLSPGETADGLRASLGQEFQRSDDYWYIVAQAAAGRAANFGRINRFRDFEIDTYEFVAIIDASTTPACRYLDGRVFRVERAAEIVDSVMAATEPGQVRTRQRWVSFDRELAASGGDALWFRDTPDGLPPVDPAMDAPTRRYLPDSGFDLRGDEWLPRGDARDGSVNLSLEQLGTVLPPLHARCRSDVVISQQSVDDYLRGR